MKVLRVLGWTMIWSGGLILAFLAYQLWGTSIVTDRAQAEAAAELDEIFEETLTELVEDGQPVPPAVVGSTPPEGTESEPVLYPEPKPAEGTPFARLTIEGAGVDHVLFEGVSRDTLKSGPGHMPWTPLPGQPGNAVISGHRTTYDAPFFDLDLLGRGDRITVQTATGSHVYEVDEWIVVEPDDVWVTESREGAWLTLTTCHPKRSARQRLVVFAELVEGPNYEFAQTLITERNAS